ncbi:hypothetical protein FRC17_004077 [Serendipita sp. 399]|nr:hypothetical protein FRC17_004077 [Serendipita sp. 399]
MAQMNTTVDGTSAHCPSSLSDSINRLPDEILVDVFWRHIISDHVRQNASLRSVCRRWKTLVDSTPTLWSILRITPSREARSILTCRRLAQFCIKQSRTSPLDIDLDLGHTSELSDSQTLAEKKPGMKFDIFILFFIFWFFSGVDNASFIDGAAFRSDILKLVGTVTDGDDSKTQDRKRSAHQITFPAMLRWRKFRIVLGQFPWDVKTSIFLQFTHPTPSLETLEVLDGSYNPNVAPNTLDSFSNPSVLPYLGNLQTFHTNFDLEISHFFHRNADEFTGVSLHGLSVIATLPTLRRIAGYPNVSDLRISNAGAWIVDSAIIFPQLHSLTIDGGVLAWLVTTIAAPRLRRVRMSSDHFQAFPISDLLLPVQSLEWDVPFKPYSVRDLLAFLSSVFTQCPRLEDLTMWSLSRSILASSSGEFEGIVERLLKEHPLPLLKSITLLRPRTGDFDHAEVAIVIHPPSPAPSPPPPQGGNAAVVDWRSGSGLKTHYSEDGLGHSSFTRSAPPSI